MNPAKEDARLQLRKANEWLDENNIKPEKYIADEVISFDADHGRIGIIWYGTRQECLCCHVIKEALVIDQSEGEYAQAVICIDCIDILRKATI